MCPTDEPNFKRMLSGEDFTLKVDDELRERLINELRMYPNILVFCGDEKGGTRTFQGDPTQLAKAIIVVLREDKMLFDWLKAVMTYV